jgi:hypothetical protein
MGNSQPEPTSALGPQEETTDSHPTGSSADVVKIYVYRHLLQNLESTRRAMRQQEKIQAVKVKGPRAAALLARLWANDDLQLPATPQKVISHDLGLSDSETTKLLKEFRSPSKNGERCVELISDGFSREKHYRITDAGKRALASWVLIHYTHESFHELIKEAAPVAKNVTLSLNWLKSEAKRKLGVAE